MAQETIGIKVEVQGGESVGSLKKQLKEAQREVETLSEKFGATSEQAVKAARRAAELKDAIGDAKALTDAYNPDAKFKAFGQAIQGVVGGFTALQGALGLVGVESEDVQKTLLKVQSALALSQGIDSVLESADAFANLGKKIGITSGIQKLYAVTTGLVSGALRLVGINATVASVGVQRFSTALLATGIGAVVIGLGYLATSFLSAGDAADTAAEKAKKLKEQLEALDEARTSSQTYIDRQTRIIQNEEKLKDLQLSAGKNEKEIEATRKQILTDRINDLAVEIETKKGLLSTDEKLRLEAEKFRLQRELARVDLEKTAKTEREAEDKKKKASEKAKAEAEKDKEKRKKDNEERIQAEKDAAQNILDLQDEIFLQSIEDETQRALVKLSQDKERQINEINLTKATAEQKLQQIKLIEDKFKQEKDAIEKEDAEKRKEKEQKDAEELTQKRNESLAKEREFLEAQKKEREEFQRAELEATRELQERKFQAVNAGLDLVGSLAGKNEAIGNVIYTIQKAIEIGRIITSTTSAIAQIKAQTAAIPAILPPGIPNKAFFAALAIGTKKIAGLKIGAAANIATIVGSSIAKFKGGAGGGSIGGTDQTASVGGVGSVGAPVSPQLPEAQLTQLDQTSINRLGSATNRSYVLESDVTNSQERITRINRAARLN